MGYFYSIRGWLEVVPKDFAPVTERLAAIIQSYPTDSVMAFYAKGWCWNQQEINHARFIFYGASVRENGIAQLEMVLRSLLELGIEMYGYFHIQGEEVEDA